jgi:hypothetical protein
MLKGLLQAACFTLQPAQQWSTCSLSKNVFESFKDRAVPPVLKECMDAPQENAAALAAFAAMHAFLRKSLLDRAVLAISRVERLWPQRLRVNMEQAAEANMNTKEAGKGKPAADGLAAAHTAESSVILSALDTPVLLDGAALSNLEVRHLA